MDIVINYSSIHIRNTAALFQMVAKDFMQRAIKAVNEKQLFTVVLSGGQTPKLFFDALVKNVQEGPEFSWEYIKFFFGDERYVSADDPGSNYHLAYTGLFSKLPIPRENICEIPTNLKDPQVSAEKYAQTLRNVLNIKNDELPLFDLVYLGLGVNGHTASLMPGSRVVKAFIDAKNGEKRKQKWVIAVYVPELHRYRITFTPSILNNSKRICFLVTGADKALTVWKVLQGPFEPLQYPAQLIQCVHGETAWYLDQAAAAQLRRPAACPRDPGKDQ